MFELSACAQDIIEFDNPYLYESKSKGKDDSKRDYKVLRGEVIKSPELNEEQELQLELLKQEPKFPEVERQMLAFSALPTGEEFRRYRKQARMRNILPTVNGDYDRNRQRYFSYGYDSSYDNLIPNAGSASPSGTYNHSQSQSDWSDTRTGYRTRGFSAGIEWHLPGLIYDNEVTDLLSEQRRIAGIRNDLIDRLHDVFFDRKRKQVEFILNPPSSESEEVIYNLELQELTAKIDSMTGGWFSNVLESRQLNKDFNEDRISKMY
ncbi:MAG: hypothetical protein SFU25_10495 [Candidatus Caenarcaniphilales bacterium]|nr:hypothetical protein [Candidatus Caenarcaniphilales bacterium]